MSRSLRPRPCRRRQAGFTLVETIVGFVIFVIVIIGIYASLMAAYKLSVLTRYQDNARTLLRAYADQFQRLETMKGNSRLWLFQPTGTDGDGNPLKDGTGLEDLGRLCNADMTTPVTVGPKMISLGAEEYAIPAYVSRQVRAVRLNTGITPARGDTTAVIEDTEAGYLLQATFEVSFTFDGKEHSETITTLRLVD